MMTALPHCTCTHSLIHQLPSPTASLKSTPNTHSVPRGCHSKSGPPLPVQAVGSLKKKSHQHWENPSYCMCLPTGQPPLTASQLEWKEDKVPVLACTTTLSINSNYPDGLGVILLDLGAFNAPESERITARSSGFCTVQNPCSSTCPI